MKTFILAMALIAAAIGAGLWAGNAISDIGQVLTIALGV